MTKRVNIYLPDINSLKPQIKVFGEWKRAEEVIDDLPNILQGSYEIAAAKFSKDLLNIVRKSIKTGNPPGGLVHWPPLSYDYSMKKGHDRPYIFSGYYSRSVSIFKRGKKVFIGLPPGVRYPNRGKRAGLTLNQVAKILEFGSNKVGIPARPLWGPALITAGGVKQIRKEILTNIRRGLSKYGIRPNQVKW